jgi:hypothetical protein
VFKAYTTAQASLAGGAGGGPAAGGGLGPGPGGWHPTVLYMLGLIVAEIAGVAVLSRYLLR